MVVAASPILPTSGCSGETGHYEAVDRVRPFEDILPDLLDVFWSGSTRPTPPGQFMDRGSQYRTAIFYSTEQSEADGRRAA